MLVLGDKASAGATSILKQRVSLSTRGPLEASALFRIGLRSLPYLADHGFQDLVVLPGSFYVEMALTVDRELSQRVAGSVRNIVFRNPIILGAEDVVIKVEVRNHGDRNVEYTFYEGDVEDGGPLVPPRQYAARLEIDRNRSTPSTADPQAFSVEAFQAESQAVIDGRAFYKTLHKNGNQYGPRFQNLATIWRTGDQSLGRLSVTPQLREFEPHYLHPSLLDSMTQVLAPYGLDTGKTFILRSIEKIDVRDLHFPDTLWGHATRLPQGDGDEEGFLGNVRVFDQSGRGYVELSGVAFTLLDRADAADEKPATNLVIASNFTAEPVEDSLRFWGDHFGVQVRVDFAPYNQIFQQLLDSGSAFRRNSDGTNVLLLGLEEWAEADRHGPMDLDQERAEHCLAARGRLERNIQDFCAALRSFMNQAKVPLVLGVCPRTPAAMADPGLQALLDDAEQILLSEAGQIANVHGISSAALLERYPVTEYYDPHTHLVADVPYTLECYAAIGTALVRTIFRQGSRAGRSRPIPAEFLASLEYDPDEGATVGDEDPAPCNAAKLTPHRRELAFRPAYSSERLQRIGENLYDVPAIAKAIEEFRLRTQPLHTPAHVAPDGTVEAVLSNIWGKVLGRPRIGINDNFFEAGGTSLRAVQVIAMIKKELNQSLSIVSLFDGPTVALLAARLRAAPGRAVPEEGTTTTGAALRGEHRRQNAVRRRAS